MYCNYHTHTTYCDGKDTIAHFVQEAIEKGFDHLGFSSHSPLPIETSFAIAEEQIPDYVKDICFWREEQDRVQLFAGLECDFIPGESQSFSSFKNRYNLDFIIGGVHLVKPLNTEGLWFIDGSKRETYDDGLSALFNREIRKAVTRFWEQTFEMIETETFDIVAHIDKIKMHNQDRFFREDEPWYLTLVDRALELVREHNLILEINSRGIYKGRCLHFYPSDYILKEAARKDIPFVVSSDAHKEGELGALYPESIEQLKAHGIKELYALVSGKWTGYAI